MFNTEKLFCIHICFCDWSIPQSEKALKTIFSIILILSAISSVYRWKSWWWKNNIFSAVEIVQRKGQGYQKWDAFLSSVANEMINNFDRFLSYLPKTEIIIP